MIQSAILPQFTLFRLLETLDHPTHLPLGFSDRVTEKVLGPIRDTAVVIHLQQLDTRFSSSHADEAHPAVHWSDLSIRHEELHAAEEVLRVRFHDELHIALARNLDHKVGEFRLHSGVQVDLRLLGDDRGAGRNEVCQNQQGEHL